LLGLAGRQTGADRAMLIAAGETLAHMPKSAALLADGLLSWGQVRAVTRAARRMSREQRAWLDERIAATAELRDLSRSDPNELVWAVDAAADELRSAREAAAADDARERDCFFSVQSDFQGGARIYADLPDPRIAAPVIAALDDAAGPPRKDGRISRPRTQTPTRTPSRAPARPPTAAVPRTLKGHRGGC
ncbi:MAG TPA: hypothetical protein VML96_11465, partial [Egibacteraceae bacterium]|nr:hypothetical protein [Egibacteraceae bacterium]